ncbi:hypothetical protein VNO77_04473 [Canavalia gladiata]|uniref:Uncharacterized protein n=1 Tax=Canavalia gladiata TaxID=3824 RepID=A0AAN9N1Q3_CANGL
MHNVSSEYHPAIRAGDHLVGFLKSHAPPHGGLSFEGQGYVPTSVALFHRSLVFSQHSSHLIGWVLYFLSSFASLADHGPCSPSFLARDDFCQFVAPSLHSSDSVMDKYLVPSLVLDSCPSDAHPANHAMALVENDLKFIWEECIHASEANSPKLWFDFHYANSPETYAYIMPLSCRSNKKIYLAALKSYSNVRIAHARY